MTPLDVALLGLCRFISWKEKREQLVLYLNINLENQQSCNTKLWERERERVREEESSSSGKREDGENKAMSIITLFLFFCCTKSREVWCGAEPKRLGVCIMSFNDVPFTTPLENVYIYIYIFFFFWSTENFYQNITFYFYFLAEKLVSTKIF